MSDVAESAAAGDLRGGQVFVAQSRFGQGVFAARVIGLGQVFLAFDGPLVRAAQQVSLGEAQEFLLQVDDEMFVLPDAPGRYVNHSCLPNAGLRDGRFLVALRDIAPDEEITFDYATSVQGDPWTMACGCEAPGCRGLIGAFAALPLALRVHYLRLGVVPDFIAVHHAHER